MSAAAVECRAQPRLLVNPEFVAAHANTPEKLLMLVMHELHHFLLGHTTLFARTTMVQNFVFDAVINGLICRMFPEGVNVLTRPRLSPACYFGWRGWFAGAAGRGTNFSNNPCSAISFSIASISIGTNADRFS